MTQLMTTAPRGTDLARMREVTLPGWRRGTSQAAIVWTLAYGGLRVSWAVTGAPSTVQRGSDVVGAAGWWSVAPCAAAAAVVLALRNAPWLRTLAATRCLVAALGAAGALLLLMDGVGLPLQ